MATQSNNDIAKAIYLVSKDKPNNELHDINTKIIKFLIRKRLLSKTSDILDRLSNIVNKENGRIIVKVSSSENLKDNFKKELLFFLKERYKAKEVILEEVLDKRLLGGVKLEVNNEIIDLTISEKLKKLQEYLIRKV